MDLEESQRQEQPEGDEKVLARDTLSFQSKTTSFSFFRAGRIKSLGKSGQVKGGIKSHQRPIGWGSKLRELVGLSVAKSEATCLFVMLSQPDVLREFPALPIEVKLTGTETARPDGGSAQRNRAERGDTDPGGGREIAVRKAGVTEGRKRFREALKALGGSSTTGPNGRLSAHH